MTSESKPTVRASLLSVSFITGALGLFAVLSFLGGIIAAFSVIDIFGEVVGLGIPLFLILQGMLFAVLLSALIVLIDLLTDIRMGTMHIRMSTKRQEKMVPSLLGTINNSIQSFKAGYQQKTTEVELVDDTEDKGD